MGSMTMNFSILASSKDSHQVLATAVKAGATESDRKCQAQYNLASLVPVQLGTDTGLIIPGDPKKSIPLFGVSGGTQVFAKQLNRHIFG